MTVEHAVRSKLVATASVSDLVSTRVFQLRLPQKPTLPAIRLQLIDEPKDYHLRGESGATRARLQVDVYGSESVASVGNDPYESVTTIADAVDAVLSGQVFESEGLRITGSMRQSRRVGYEAEELRVLRCTQDYTVWFKELSS